MSSVGFDLNGVMSWPWMELYVETMRDSILLLDIYIYSALSDKYSSISTCDWVGFSPPLSFTLCVTKYVGRYDLTLRRVLWVFLTYPNRRLYWSVPSTFLQLGKTCLKSEFRKLIYFIPFSINAKFIIIFITFFPKELLMKLIKPLDREIGNFMRPGNDWISFLTGNFANFSREKICPTLISTVF